jgi:hypothetical protein
MEIKRLNITEIAVARLQLKASPFRVGMGIYKPSRVLIFFEPRMMCSWGSLTTPTAPQRQM